MNVNERDPIYGKFRYNYTLVCIRRAIVDDFWIRGNSTFLEIFRRLRQDYFNSRDVLSIIIPVPIIGTNEARYQFGMSCKIQTLDYLSDEVKFQDQLQWGSMGRTPTRYNNS